MSPDRTDAHNAAPETAPPVDQRIARGNRREVVVQALGRSFGRFWATQSGAFLGLLTVAFSTYAAAYYARRDTNRQTFEQCRSATSGWITELRLSGEIAKTAATAIKAGQTFSFTPFDDEMRSRNPTFALLDGSEIDVILRTELFYRAMRTSLSTVIDTRHAGDTYFVASKAEQGFIRFAALVTDEADHGVRLLSQSRQCKLLRRTAWF